MNKHQNDTLRISYSPIQKKNENTLKRMLEDCCDPEIIPAEVVKRHAEITAKQVKLREILRNPGAPTFTIQQSAEDLRELLTPEALEEYREFLTPALQTKPFIFASSECS